MIAPSAQATVSETLCRHIAEMSFAALPPATIEMASRALLDGIGVMIAASGMSPDVEPFLSIAARSPGGPCRVLGTDLLVPAEAAAFANGAMAHALDYEDAFDAAPSHPNASLIPAALALAQETGASGPELLAALAIGCDLVCRMALSLRRPMEAGGWYPPPILGAYGAAAACARLLRLDWEQTRSALSLTLCQATMPGAIKHNRATNIRAIREAFPAQAAINAARLAAQGVIGFEAPLEGRDGFFDLYADGEFDPGVLLANLGTRFHGEMLSFKPWPSCRGTHVYIELAAQLIHDKGVKPDQIAAIRAGIDPVTRMLIEPLDRKQAPAVAIDAKFSIPFTIALAGVRGQVTLDDFDAASLHDPQILALAARVSAVEPGAHGWPAGSGGFLEVESLGGETTRGELLTPLGSPARPLDRAALIEKFVDCCGRGQVQLAAPDARELADAILAIADCKDVRSVLR